MKIIATTARRVLVILACTFAAIAAGAAHASGIALAKDLALEARSARDARVPLVVFYTQPDCPYCELARRNYLEPMLADPAYRGRMRLIEVDITSMAPLTDLDGRAVTHAAFAGMRKVRFVPTVQFVSPAGDELAPALIGITVPGFYQSYLDDRLSTSATRLGAGAR